MPKQGKTGDAGYDFFLKDDGLLKHMKLTHY